MSTRRHMYRVLSVPLNHPPFPYEISAVAALSEKVDVSDFYFEIEDETLLCYLNRFDPVFHQTIIDEYAKTHLDEYYPSPSKNPFRRLLAEILAIGSYGISSGKRIYVDYNSERKVVDRKAKQKKRKEYFYAEGHDFSSTRNELEEKFVNQIICGDSLEVLRRLPDNCIDIIITSPPYNFGLAYDADTGDDAKYWEQYLSDLFAIFDECVRVLVWGGRFIVNIQPLFSEYIPIHHIISNHLMNRHLIWKGEILWEKNNYNCKYTAWGSWKSPASPYLKYTWEFLEIFCKGEIKKTGKRDMIDITDEEFKSWVVARWSIAPERNMKAYGHPAVFPEELVMRCLKLFSYQGDIVLDPFNGAGTTTYVADRLNRRYIGIDISEDYCKRARMRLSESQNGQSRLVT
ncbi:MAG: site-specific DNA-methyltransferase [Euryarchaeota archaeon]|nr:site-specific DNA-methyltransferase [Euryarchaeota archaeon]